VAKEAVDELDRLIIAALQANGRSTNTQIAAELGIAESTVRKRIDRLIDQGTMKITAVVNPLELNYPIVAIFGLRVTPNRVTAVGELLSELSEFRFIGVTVGAWDFITEGWFESLDQMHRFLSEKLWLIEGVTRVEVSHIIKMVRYAYDWSGDVSQGSVGEAVAPKLAAGRK
jgi:Lrp/AsnC family transcriptional regulator for asnA, asnC and gidA